MAGREDKGKNSSKRDRYWSVMLVGDHGRVIPFRHFKGLALTFICAFILVVIALGVVAFLYANQIKTIASLESQIVEARLQNSKLRDEKDLYLTKLTLQESRKADKSEVQTPVIQPEKKSDPPPVVEEIQKPPKVAMEKKEGSVKKETTAKKQAPNIKRMAEIRKFSVSYDAKREVLRAQFRIYNKSKPKKPLSGRSTVVFKHLDEPPIKWMPVPAVILNDGKPPADKGQAFQIRNYLTMKFRAYRQKAPIHYNSLTAYVFSDDGQLLASKDFSVNIDVPAPVKKDTAKPSSKPTEAPSPKPQEATTSQSTEAASPKPSETAPAQKPIPVEPNAKEKTIPQTSPGSQDTIPQRDAAPSNTGTAQDNRNPDATTPSPPQEGAPANTSPSDSEPPKGPDGRSLEPQGEQKTGRSSPDDTPGYDAQNPTLPTTEPNEAAPKPRTEGETR